MAHIQCGRNVLRGLIKNGASQRGSDSITHPMLFASQGLRYRKLEIILTTSVENLGKAGETVKVAPGYFRNHLMAKMFDVPNIEKYAYLIREQRKMLVVLELESAMTCGSPNIDGLSICNSYVIGSRAVIPGGVTCVLSLVVMVHLHQTLNWEANSFCQNYGNSKVGKSS
ncbi:hypothetical protein MKW94_014241 [Papaver nudicaule]|uniref:Large ribosomal subunit protein bL9c n=1 Tax=Papaver nudicaule TaxID=74823 RepID=A0AA41V9E7_PAPNU|nr:hypothetical protein [Papaver nudicaule]